MKLREIMQQGPVIPVLTIDDPAHAVPLARALVAGGLPVLEVTLRTAAAVAAIAAMAAQVPGAIVGAGTLTRPEDFRRVRNAGAQFAVSPGLTPALVEAAADCQLPFLPGVMTPSEVMYAQAAGFTELKLFPAVPAGGIGMLKALAGPFPELAFCPTGGSEVGMLADFLALPNVLCVGGSWVAPAQAVAQGDWARITQLAAACRQSRL